MTTQNETNILSNYSLEVCINDIIKPLTLDVFAVMCDRYVYKRIVDFITRFSPSTYVYTFYNNKIEATLLFTKNE